MIAAMIYVLRTGCPWRDLPAFYGPWSSVYMRWRRWCRSGLWDVLLQRVSQHPAGVLRHLDATHVKVHQDASTGGHQQTECIGKTKGGLNTKVTALVDGQGRALELALTPGPCADVCAAVAINLPAHKRIVADKGYDSDAFRQRIRDHGSQPCIPPRCNRSEPRAWRRDHYRKRHRVENFFQRLKRRRRIATRYEKLSLHYLAFIQLAAVLDWLTF
jgi:transposase